MTPVTPTTPPTAAGPANDKAMGATLIGCFKDNPDADYVELRKARRNWERMTAEVRYVVLMTGGNGRSLWYDSVLSPRSNVEHVS